MRPLLAVLLATFACSNSAANKDVPAKEPTPPPTSTPRPPPPALPATAPAHAPLQEVDGKYIGVVARECPWAGTPRTSKQTVPTLASTDYKLVGDKLEIRLPFGGCPTWAGYTVVTGPGSPLPFYVCDEVDHDVCEMDGYKTWVFDISSQLAANNATAVEFAVPTGVH